MSHEYVSARQVRPPEHAPPLSTASGHRTDDNVPENWRSVQLVLHGTFTPAKVLDCARAQIRIIAADAGEFVQDFRIRLSATQRPGWKTWTVSYLLGRESISSNIFPANATEPVTDPNASTETKHASAQSEPIDAHTRADLFRS